MNGWELAFNVMFLSVGFTLSLLLLCWSASVAYDTLIRWRVNK